MVSWDTCISGRSGYCEANHAEICSATSWPRAGQALERVALVNGGGEEPELIRLQHSTQPKQCSSWSHPQRRAKELQSDQSNWNSSPGVVSIDIVTRTVPWVGPCTECR